MSLLTLGPDESSEQETEAAIAAAAANRAVYRTFMRVMDLPQAVMESDVVLTRPENRPAPRTIVHGAVTLLKRYPMLSMIPPSARSDAPFVTADSGLAMYVTSDATSDGSAKRRISDSGRELSK